MKAINAFLRTFQRYGVDLICSTLLFPLFPALVDRRKRKPPSSWNGKLSATKSKSWRFHGVSRLQHRDITRIPSESFLFGMKSGD